MIDVYSLLFVGLARAFSAHQAMTTRNGLTVAETDRCRGRARQVYVGYL